MKTKRTMPVLIIVSIWLAIAAVSVSMGYFLIYKNFIRTAEDNMTAASNMAAEMTAGKLAELDLQISGITEQIACMGYAETKQFLDSCVKNNTFFSMRVFYRDGRVISCGNDFFNIDKNAERAFQGETVIGSPLWNGTKIFVFRVYKPVDQNRILAVTFPGQYISSMISSYKVWNNGTIFILDKEGMLIGSPWENMVFNNVNFMETAKYSPEYRGMADVSRKMIRGETGMSKYSMEGQNQITLFRPIPGSGGWSLGVIYPINESAMANIKEPFLGIAAILFFFSLFIVFFFSGFRAKPYDHQIKLPAASRGVS